MAWNRNFYVVAIRSAEEDTVNQIVSESNCFRSRRFGRICTKPSFGMKYDITLKQQAMIDHKLNVTQFAILDVIATAPTWADCIVVNKEVYYWTSRTMIVEELKAFDLKFDTVYRHLTKLAVNGFIDFKKIGKKDCVRLTQKSKSIFSSAIQNKRENPYVGKKSENGDNTMSEKNPRKLGKKSEKHSEKNPTDQYTNLHPHTNNPSSSSSPPISEEDENELVGCEIVTTLDPYLELSEYVEELPRQIVIDGINAIAIERGGDFEKYRDSLIREVRSGKGRTLTNIRARITRVNLAHEKPWIIANRLKRQQGEELAAALRASGHGNIFDYLEEMKHEKNA